MSTLEPSFHKEPAHPGVIKLHEDLVAIYRAIQDKQGKLDAAFDRISRQIGFVVLTAVPVTLRMEAKKGTVSVATENLKGTLFETDLLKEVESLPGAVRSTVGDGEYKLYLIWHEALKLKLQTDWMEPAHLSRIPQGLLEAGLLRGSRALTALGPGVPEPAHWFDPGFRLELEEVLAISAIDQVYPDLRLTERIKAARQVSPAALMPGIREPAHFRRFLEQADPGTLQRILDVIQDMPAAR